MEMVLLEGAVYIHPPFPVEFSIIVDGKAIRVAIPWSTVERLMGGATGDVQRVHEFLHGHRQEIALAIKAHLFAQGFPSGGELMMLPKDFDAVHPV